MPPASTEPDDGRRMPIRFFSSVVLPTPLRPMMQVTLPSGMVMFTSRKACTAP